MNRAALLIPLALTACLSPGCASPKAEAQSEIAGVSERAKSIESRLTQAQMRLLSIMPQPDAVMDAMIADSLADARAIQSSALKASAAVGETEDPEPMWAKALKRLMLLALVGGGIFLLIYFAPVLKPLLNMVGLLIPRVTKMDAKFDAEAVVAGTATPTQRESISANRVTDPVYEREFLKQKAKAEKAKGN